MANPSSVIKGVKLISKLDTAAEAGQNVATAAQWAGYLAKRGIKRQELQDTRILERLGELDPNTKLTKAELKELISQQRLPMQVYTDVDMGQAYRSYFKNDLGENDLYGETVLTVDSRALDSRQPDKVTTDAMFTLRFYGDDSWPSTEVPDVKDINVKYAGEIASEPIGEGLEAVYNAREQLVPDLEGAASKHFRVLAGANRLPLGWSINAYDGGRRTFRQLEIQRDLRSVKYSAPPTEADIKQVFDELKVNYAGSDTAGMARDIRSQARRSGAFDEAYNDIDDTLGNVAAQIRHLLEVKYGRAAKEDFTKLERDTRLAKGVDEILIDIIKRYRIPGNTVEEDLAWLTQRLSLELQTEYLQYETTTFRTQAALLKSLSRRQPEELLPALRKVYDARAKVASLAVKEDEKLADTLNNALWGAEHLLGDNRVRVVKGDPASPASAFEDPNGFLIRLPEVPLESNWYMAVFKADLERAINLGAERFEWDAGAKVSDRWNGTRREASINLMDNTYVRDVSNYLNKELGVDVKIQQQADRTWGFRITDELRKAVSKGQPAYAVGGAAVISKGEDDNGN